LARSLANGLTQFDFPSADTLNELNGRVDDLNMRLRSINAFHALGLPYQHAMHEEDTRMHDVLPTASSRSSFSNASTGTVYHDPGSPPDMYWTHGGPESSRSKYKKRSVRPETQQFPNMQRAAPPGRCHSCNIEQTPEWRRGPDGARTLCNACGLRRAFHGDVTDLRRLCESSEKEGKGREPGSKF
jgi:hypothetical protein